MSNPGSACVLDSQHSNSTHQAYRRIRQRYLTGAKDLNQMLALERYDNQSVFNVLGVGKKQQQQQHKPWSLPALTRACLPACL